MGLKRWIAVFLIVSLFGVFAPVIRQIERRIVGVNPGVYLGYRSMEYYFRDEVRTIVRGLPGKLISLR